MPARFRSGIPVCMAAGAFTVGILYREFNAPFWITLPAAGVTGASRSDLRLAVAPPARALSRGQHARAALRGPLSRRRIRDQARLFDRHPGRPAGSWGWRSSGNRTWYFIFLAAAALTLLLPQPDAVADRTRLAAPSARMRPSPALLASTSARKADGVCHLLRHDRGRRRAVRATGAASSRSRRSRCSCRSSMSP